MNNRKPLTKEFIDTETNTLKDLVQAYVQYRGQDGTNIHFLAVFLIFFLVWRRLALKKIQLLSERHPSISIKDVFHLFLQMMKLFTRDDYHRLELRTKYEALFFCIDQWKIEVS